MYIAFRIILALVMIFITLILYPLIVFRKISKKINRLIANKEFDEAKKLIGKLELQSDKPYTVSEYYIAVYYMEYGDLPSVLSMVPIINNKYKRHQFKYNAYIFEIKALYLMGQVDEAFAKEEEHREYFDMIQEKGSGAKN
jgi:hypothetical protein